jgi:hypothetical protein
MKRWAQNLKKRRLTWKFLKNASELHGGEDREVSEVGRKAKCDSQVGTKSLVTNLIIDNVPELHGGEDGEDLG